ncbi:hypothetical protein EVAR_27720_1 [Eumeta japonica]|uniref:Uncharacterized protein n=1 Tax=Eumeta variegata TaxID=151549 RepID=A0A4C1WRN1_EUMVA|nr:hypothetical protein EVAR_27720_1 [Eumeta japonica]
MGRRRGEGPAEGGGRGRGRRPISGLVPLFSHNYSKFPPAPSGADDGRPWPDSFALARPPAGFIKFVEKEI